jgi:starvation-inducible DNA-binding protein
MALNEDRMVKQVASALEVVLADTYALFLKTQNYHWNVEGQNFKALHEMFEAQYDDLFEAIDTTAELIRGLGQKTIGTFGDFAKLTNIEDGDSGADARHMLEDLLHDNELIERTLAKAFEASDEAKDEVVSSFLCDRMTVHRKNAWMLRSSASE